MKTWTPKQSKKWREVEIYLNSAKSIHFDGCHKIYICMDKEGTDRMVGIGYEDVSPSLWAVQHWWENSCFLRFVQVIYNTGDDNDDYYPVIGQGDPIFGNVDEEEEY